MIITIMLMLYHVITLIILVIVYTLTIVGYILSNETKWDHPKHAELPHGSCEITGGLRQLVIPRLYHGPTPTPTSASEPLSATSAVSSSAWAQLTTMRIHWSEEICSTINCQVLLGSARFPTGSQPKNPSVPTGQRCARTRKLIFEELWSELPQYCDCRYP